MKLKCMIGLHKLEVSCLFTDGKRVLALLNCKNCQYCCTKLVKENEFKEFTTTTVLR